MPPAQTSTAAQQSRQPSFEAAAFTFLHPCGLSPVRLCEQLHLQRCT
jgi:hypothetical protein